MPCEAASKKNSLKRFLGFLLLGGSTSVGNPPEGVLRRMGERPSERNHQILPMPTSAAEKPARRRWPGGHAIKT